MEEINVFSINGKVARKMRRRLNKITYTRLVALGYFLLLVVGTFFLMLPVSSKSGLPTSFVDALTTATSASCVTGLVVFDTFTHWTVFGQIVILVLIQIGGLGYMTIITLFSVIIGRKIGLRERSMLKESMNSLSLGGLIQLTKKVTFGTIFFELTGAIVLATRFIGPFGLRRGIYFGIFHSVSAFCNAGFDLMGVVRPYSSLTSFNSDPVVLITIMVLIVCGGIGFVVWNDVHTHRFEFRKYRLHSKIAIVMSVLLISAGAITMYALEYENTLEGMSIGDKVLNAVFSSVTTRTAGFNSIATERLTPGSTLINIVYMLIGGSPGSTAGGMKTTTIAVLLLAANASIRNDSHINVAGRRIKGDIVRKALTVVIIYISFVFTASLFIGITNPRLSLSELLFEICSAIGTVGLSCGVTSVVNIPGQMALTLLMYCGRVGSMSFALIFTEHKSPSHIKMPEEKIIIG